MTFLMPEAGRHWLGHQQRLRGQMLESWWVTHDVTGDDRARAREGAGYAVTGPGDLVDWYRVRAGSRVGVVSMFGDLRLELPAGFTGRIDQWPVLPGRDVTSRLDARAVGDEQPALPSLRATRERYDVLIIALDDAPAEFACRMVAEGLIERAWARLSRDAALVCVLPSDKDVALAVQQGLRAATQHEGDTRVRFADLRVGGRVCLGILADRGAGGGDRGADWASDEQRLGDHRRATGGPESLATGR